MMLGLLLLLVLVLVAALAGPASAEALKTEFTTNSFSHYAVGPVVTPSGPHVGHQQGTIEAYDFSSDPRLTGLTSLIENLNGNFNAKTNTLSLVGGGTYETVVYEVDSGGNLDLTAPTGDVWKGTFTEKIEIVFDAGGNIIGASGTGRMDGHGVAGSVAGLQVKATTQIDPLTMIVLGTGYIIEK
jgi:hypothetical protein